MKSGRRMAYRIALAGLLTAGCARDIRVLRAKPGKGADLSAVRTVAVAPFQDAYSGKWHTLGHTMIGEHDNGEIVRGIFLRELDIEKPFKVLGPKKYRILYRRSGIRGPIDTREKAGQLGKKLGVDAVFTGKVIRYHRFRHQFITRVSFYFELELVESGTGRLLWRGKVKLDQKGLKVKDIAFEGLRMLLKDLKREKASAG